MYVKLFFSRKVTTEKGILKKFLKAHYLASPDQGPPDLLKHPRRKTIYENI